MTKRKHRNDKRRITAKERAIGVAKELNAIPPTPFIDARKVLRIQRALAAHARAALERARDRGGR